MEMRLLHADELMRFYTGELEYAFPRAELKPLRAMLDALETGTYHPWGLFDGDELLGGAFAWEYEPGWVLFDYLCVARAHRNGGMGAKLIAHLVECERGNVLFGESEVPDCAPDPDIARRRLGFYCRNGAREAGYDMTLFGVPFRTLYWAEHDVPADEIMAHHRALYHKRFAPALYEKAIGIPWTLADGMPKKMDWREMEEEFCENSRF